MKIAFRFFANGVLACGIVLLKPSICEEKKGTNSFDVYWKHVRDFAKDTGIRDLIPDSDFVDEPLQQVKDIIDSGIPASVAYGFAMGYASGYFLKKIGRIVAFSIGSVFIASQILAYNGYIHLNNEKLREQMQKMLGIEHDGTFNLEDASRIQRNLMNILSSNLPAGSGFGLGFVLGVK